MVNKTKTSLEKISDRFTVNRYYQMSNHQLELEAAEYHIGGYATANGSIIREYIIKQLLEKDAANNSRIAVFISILALIVSIVALFVGVK